MKNIITLFSILLCSLPGYGQSIQQLSPKQGVRNQHFSLTITATGTHFTKSTSLKVSLTSKVNGSVISSNTFSANEDTKCFGNIYIPETATPGLYNVSIQTTNEGKISLANGFTVSNQLPIPKIIRFTPNKATNGQQVDITITARYGQFTKTLPVSASMLGNSNYVKSTQQFIVVNDSTIIAKFKIPSTQQSVECNLMMLLDSFNGVPQTYIRTDSIFTITQTYVPAIASITPNQANFGDHVEMTIRSTFTKFTTVSDLRVSVGQYGPMIYATSVLVVNDSVLKASFYIPKRTQNFSYDVFVEMDGENITGRDFLIIHGSNPWVTDITPKQAAQGDSVEVVMSGTDLFLNEADSFRVFLHNSFGRFIYATNITVLNDSQLQANFSIPNGAYQGAYYLYLYIDGDYIFPDPEFDIVEGLPGPRLMTNTPNSADPGQTVEVAITGMGTHFSNISSPDHIFLLQSSSNWYTIPSTQFTVIDDSNLVAEFTIPNDAPTSLYSMVIQSDRDWDIQLYVSFTIGPVGLAKTSNVIQQLYPNPVHDKLFIETRYPTLSISIFDINGKQTVVSPQSIEQNNSLLVVPIENLGLTPDMYFIKLETEIGSEYRKFVVK